MRVLGISGLFATDKSDYPHTAPIGFFHDSAAALVQNGEVRVAVEEERLSREKHTNRFPLRAVRSCLTGAGLEVNDLDAIAYFFDERFTNRELALEGLKDPALPALHARALICDRFEQEFGTRPAAERVHFVKHHVAHAVLASVESGFNESLILVVDGNGETEGVSVFTGSGPKVELMRAYDRRDSLGRFCASMTKFLGFWPFDEYKVMGLAPYGDGERFHSLLHELVKLNPNGDYTLDVEHLPQLLVDANHVPRRLDEDPLGVYADLAAATQVLTEEIVEHVVRYWSEQTGLRHLCVVGGVAQNTSLNGCLLRLGCFDRAFVPAASHDGGTALGAAYHVEAALSGQGPRRRFVSSSPYLGPGLGNAEEIETELQLWTGMLSWTAEQNLVDATAVLLAKGEVLGWAQGRSEFGPRALGHRSILADPRKPEMRDYVNRLIKRREPFRPLAPSVLAEHAGELFELPLTGADFRFMSFVVNVRPEWVSRLGAVTHVDRTARIQVVSQADDALYHQLLSAFHERTGIPALLNTSFNNQAEPIVQTARDAIRCFLTSDLKFVAIGQFLVEKRSFPRSVIADLRLTISAFGAIEETTDDRGTHRWLVRRGAPGARRPVSAEVAEIVKQAIATPGTSIARIGGFGDEVHREVFDLWCDRLLDLEPEVR